MAFNERAKMKPLWIAAAACAVFATACSKTEPDAAPAATSTPAAAKQQPAQKANATTYPRVEIATNAGLFWFAPRLCFVVLEPGQSEVSYIVEGAGQAPDGQPVYVTISDDDYDPKTGPEMRINVGTDQPRKTPEVVWISSPYDAQVPKATTKIQGKTLEVQGAVFKRQDERLTVEGSIRVDCTRPS